MKNDKRPKKLSQDKVTVLCLLANKVFNDYMICCRILPEVEPESFFENWMQLHVQSVDEECKLVLWQIFLGNMVILRNTESERHS